MKEDLRGIVIGWLGPKYDNNMGDNPDYVNDADVDELVRLVHCYLRGRPKDADWRSEKERRMLEEPDCYSQ